MKQNRVLAISAAIVLALIVLGYGGYRYFGQDKLAAAGANRSDFEQKLMVPGPMGDTVLGNKNAPLTVIEYASLTCSHCAEFAKSDFPNFKRDYIDTGKAYFIFRGFPFDPIATGAFMLAQCAGPDRYFDFVEVLFTHQQEWAFVEMPQEALKKMALQAGFTEQKFEACVADQKIFEHVQSVAQSAAKDFGVSSTPTFFVNGEKLEGTLPYEKFDEFLKKKMAEKKS